MDYQNDPRAQKLYAFLVNWTRRMPGWAYDSNGWMMTSRSVESVTAELLDEAEFSEINLAGFLKSPDGQLIQTVVGWVLPWPASIEFNLLVNAITGAALAKQKNQQNVAAGLTFVAAAILIVAFVSE